MNAKTEARGFTLVELLVVIAVTAMLVAVVLPSMATSKDAGQGALCMSHLRQLTTAWMTYTGDNRGKLVPNGGETAQPSGLNDLNGQPGGILAQWCPGRQDMSSQLSPASAPDAANVGYKWIELGLIYPYVGSVSAYPCPADISSLSSFGARYPRVRSVAMNAWLSPIVPYENITTVESYYKVSDLVQPGPSQTFVFSDDNPVSIAEGLFVCDPQIPQWVDAPASYHNGGGGLSFADGHAEIKRWTDQTVLTEWNPPAIYPGNPGFTRLSPQQNPPRDLIFLQNASTYVK